MKMSTKGRYGLRLMLDLAIHDHSRSKVALRDIADRQEISEKYLWQIANKLKKAGLIKAALGAAGGYSLAKPAEKITLADILKALEGYCLFTPCAQTASGCARSEFCASREVWDMLSAKVMGVFASVSLSDVAEKQRQLGETRQSQT